MRFLTGCFLSAGLVLAATGVQAQVVVGGYIAGSRAAPVSDFDGPDVLVVPPVREAEPALLPPAEVYAILRENGFAPVGGLRQRGLVYTIAVVDPSGYDGRLMIDARDGRIIRFIPLERMGYLDESRFYEPFAGLREGRFARGAPRPPGLVPHVASRRPAVPQPKAAPAEARVASVRPEPSKAEVPKVDSSRAEMSASPASIPGTKASSAITVPSAAIASATPPAAEAKPVPAPVQLRPTQEMPAVQALE